VNIFLLLTRRLFEVNDVRGGVNPTLLETCLWQVSVLADVQAPGVECRELDASCRFDASQRALGDGKVGNSALDRLKGVVAPLPVLCK
jgi:hypothetical protein